MKYLVLLSLFCVLSVQGFELCSVDDPDFSYIRSYPTGKIPYCERRVSRETRMFIYESCGVEDYWNYTVDHEYSLWMGGSNNLDNLCPQPKSQSTANFEGRLYNDVRDGIVPLSQSYELMYELKDECWCTSFR